jgi:hypothetical protein
MLSRDQELIWQLKPLRLENVREGFCSLLALADEQPEDLSIPEIRERWPEHSKSEANIQQVCQELSQKVGVCQELRRQQELLQNRKRKSFANSSNICTCCEERSRPPSG